MKKEWRPKNWKEFKIKFNKCERDLKILERILFPTPIPNLKEV